jgi:hypothetical protein
MEGYGSDAAEAVRWGAVCECRVVYVALVSGGFWLSSVSPDDDGDLFLEDVLDVNWDVRWDIVSKNGGCPFCLTVGQEEETIGCRGCGR